jgi:hypothetical protein
MRSRFGRTGLEVSPIAFGAWELGGEWGAVDEQEGIEAIQYARRLGVNLFDTAQGYGSAPRSDCWPEPCATSWSSRQRADPALTMSGGWYGDCSVFHAKR